MRSAAATIPITPPHGFCECDRPVVSLNTLLVFARSERHCLGAKAFEHCKMYDPDDR